MTILRKMKEGEVTAELYGFLTTEPNEVVKPVHLKAMPAILSTAEEAARPLSAQPIGAVRLP